MGLDAQMSDRARRRLRCPPFSFADTRVQNLDRHIHQTVQRQIQKIRRKKSSILSAVTRPSNCWIKRLKALFLWTLVVWLFKLYSRCVFKRVSQSLEDKTALCERKKTFTVRWCWEPKWGWNWVICVCHIKNIREKILKSLNKTWTINSWKFKNKHSVLKGAYLLIQS